MVARKNTAQHRFLSSSKNKKKHTVIFNFVFNVKQKPILVVKMNGWKFWDIWNLEGNLFILKTSKNLSSFYFWVHSTCWDQRGEVWSGENFMIVWCLVEGSEPWDTYSTLVFIWYLNSIILHLSIFEFILYFGTQKLHWIRKSAHVTSKGVSNVLSCYHVALRRDNVWSGIFILSSNLCVFLLNSSKYLDPDFFHLHDLKLNFLKFVLVETLIILKMIFQVML